MRICALGLVLSVLVSACVASSADCEARINQAALDYVSRVAKVENEIPLEKALAAISIPDLSTVPQKLTGIRIKSVNLLNLSTTLQPGAGLQMTADLDLGLWGQLMDAAMEMTVKVSIRAEIHARLNSEKNIELSISACKTIVGGITPGSKKGSLQSVLKELRAHIHAALAEKACLQISTIVLRQNSKIARATDKLPLLAEGQIQYVPLSAPVFARKWINLPLQTTFFFGEQEIPIPPSQAPFALPEQAADSSSHVTIGLSQEFYNNFFLALQTAGAFNLTIQSELTTASLAQQGAKQQVSTQYPKPLALVLAVVFPKPPAVVLNEGEAVVVLFPTIQIGVQNPGFQVLLSLDVEMTASLQVAADNVKMMLSLEEEGNFTLSVASSKVGAVEGDQLKELFGDVIQKEILARMNELLRDGISLPHLSLIFNYVDTSVAIHKGYVLIPVNLEYIEGEGQQATEI
ncbi:protein TENP [Alligator mississippiensis]|uniref:protein TENP n=1 Tax=Alligator mississippiensis TaxID=8496 RepID=UPI0009074A47|nr:protein TENP [Alligator mississippiensis]